MITFPSNKGDGWDRPILCDTKVFQYGDAIAIVCADTEANAKAAAAKVKVDLEPLPEYMSAPAAMADDTPISAWHPPMAAEMVAPFLNRLPISEATSKNLRISSKRAWWFSITK